jgi:hypothetical protein
VPADAAHHDLCMKMRGYASTRGSILRLQQLL